MNVSTMFPNVSGTFPNMSEMFPPPNCSINCNHHDNATIYRNDPINFVYGSLTLFSFLFGSPLNALSLHYFLRKPKHLSTLVYIPITATDLLLCLLAGPVSYSYLSERDPGLFALPVFCQLWGNLWNATARLSVFLVAVLSISRTVSMRYPFKRVSKRKIVGLIVGYAVVQAVQSTIPYWFGHIYHYYETHIQCQWFSHEIGEIQEHGYLRISYSVIMFLEMALPVPPILISCLISVRELHKNQAAPFSKQAVTRTVVLFTLTYIVFNLPFCTYFTLANVDRFTNFSFQFFAFDEPSHNFRSFVVLISVILNSTANPVVYLLRFRRLRLFMEGLVGGNKSGVSVFGDSGTGSDYPMRPGRISNATLKGNGTMPRTGRRSTATSPTLQGLSRSLGPRAGRRVVQQVAGTGSLGPRAGRGVVGGGRSPSAPLVIFNMEAFPHSQRTVQSDSFTRIAHD